MPYNRLRHSAKALGLSWPKDMPLKQFEKGLDQANPRHAGFMTAVRRAGPGASYAPYQPGMVPWHSAMAATYAHATARCDAWPTAMSSKRRFSSPMDRLYLRNSD